MQFHTIQDGAFIVNLEAIASIQVWPAGATVTLIDGSRFDFQGQDFTDLMEWVNARHE